MIKFPEHIGVVVGHRVTILSIVRTFAEPAVWVDAYPYWTVMAVLEDRNRMVHLRLRGKDELDVMQRVLRIARRDEEPPYEF